MCADVKRACLRRPIEARRRQSPRRAIIATSSRRHFSAASVFLIHRSRRRVARQSPRGFDEDDDG